VHVLLHHGVSPYIRSSCIAIAVTCVGTWQRCLQQCVGSQIPVSMTSNSIGCARNRFLMRRELCRCRGKYNPIPTSYSLETHALVAALLQKEPLHRPSASAVLEMPYVRQHVQVRHSPAAAM